MTFSQKCMFLSLDDFKKDDNVYHILKVLDKSDNENLTLYTNKPEKYKNIKPYTDLDLNFILNKRFNKETKSYYWSLGLNEVD